MSSPVFNPQTCSEHYWGLAGCQVLLGDCKSNIHPNPRTHIMMMLKGSAGDLGRFLFVRGGMDGVRIKGDLEEAVLKQDLKNGQGFSR